MNLMPYLSFHRSILTISRALARPSASTNFSPSLESGSCDLSGLFFVECSGNDGSAKGWRWSRMEARRQVRELKTEGFAERRYVLRQACFGLKHALLNKMSLDGANIS